MGTDSPQTGAIGWSDPVDGYDWYCIRGTAGREITLEVERTSGTDEALTPNLAVWAGAVQDGNSVSALPLPGDGLEKSTANSSSSTAQLSITPTRNGPITVSVSTWTAAQDGADYELSADGVEKPSSCTIGAGIAPPSRSLRPTVMCSRPARTPPYRLM